MKFMFDQIIVHLPYSLLRLICLVIQGLEVCPLTPIHSCLIHVIDRKLILVSLTRISRMGSRTLAGFELEGLIISVE